MAESFQYVWASPVALTVTALNSLGDGNLWNSGAVSPGTPTPGLIDISYTIVLGGAWASPDVLRFWVIGSDGDGSTPIWPGGVSATAGTITSGTAAASNFLSAVGPPNHQDPGQTTHGTSFSGVFRVYDPTPNWQLVVRVVSNTIAASGNTVRYRYATRQRITT